MVDFVKVYDIHTQARGKLFDAIRPLSQEQYTREFPFAHKTLRATMLEIAMTELWLGMRMREERMPEPFDWGSMPINETSHSTFAQLEPAWADLARRTRATLERTRDWDRVVQTVMRGRKRTRTLTAAKGDIATQILLHEVHHRAQAMVMLRHLGSPVEDVDYIYFRQKEQVEAATAG